MRSIIRLNKVGGRLRDGGGTFYRTLRTVSRGGWVSRFKTAVGISPNLELPIPPSGLERTFELHGFSRVDPFGRLNLKLGAGKRYLDQEQRLYQLAPHHRHVKGIRRELNQIQQRVTTFIEGGEEDGDQASLLEIGSRYNLYLSEGSECYARDPTRGMLKVPFDSKIS